MGSQEVSVDEGSSIAIPEALPAIEQERWESMTAAQRRRAADRLTAIQRWEAGVDSIEEALAATDLSRSRFYRMAAEFRAAPSLAALGAFAGAGGKGKLDSNAVNALQAVVSKVVKMNAGASVSQLVQLMTQEAGVTKGLPGVSKLRAIVETELRRVAAKDDAGHAIKLDFTAINLPRDDGRPHMIYVVLDVGTRLIFGAAIGSENDVLDGYRRAALDARNRIGRIGSRLPWAMRTKQMEVVAGLDEAASIKLIERLEAGGIRFAQLFRKPKKRFGSYFRAVVGSRIGRIEITPNRTEEGAAVPDNGNMTPWSVEEAVGELRLEVERHNDAILETLDGETGRRVPDDLILLLDILAG